MTDTTDTFIAMLHRCVVGVDPDEAALADLAAYHAAHGDMGTFEHLAAMMPPAAEPDGGEESSRRLDGRRSPASPDDVTLAFDDLESEITLADVLRPLTAPRPAPRWHVDDPMVIALYLLILVSLGCAIAASIHLGWLPSR